MNTTNTANVTSTARGITIPSITIPTLTSMFTNSQTGATTKGSGNMCDCGCCQTSSKGVFHVRYDRLQNLFNMIPKVNITNSNTCSDPDCGCDQP